MIYLLQETHLRQIQQKRARAQLQRLGMDLHAGQETPWTRTARGHRPDTQRCLGVACAYDRRVRIYPVQPLTPNGQKAYQEGRLQILQIPHKTGEPTLIFNVYAPAGTGKRGERETFFAAIHEEVAAHNSHKSLIGGDFNCSLRSNLLAARLCPLGWTIPPLRDGKGRKAMHTYASGQRATWIDGYLLGPGITLERQAQIVETKQLTQHARVSLRIPAQREESWPHVKPPPRLRIRRDTPPKSELNGEHFRATQQALLQQCSSGPLELQSQIDMAWEAFEQTYRKELVHLVEVDRGRLSDLGQVQLDWHPSPQTCSNADRMSAKPVLDAQSHVYRLLSYRDQQGSKARKRLERDRDSIQKILKLSPEEFDHALEEPSQHVEEWQKRVHAYARTHAQTGIEKWKRQLWSQNRPQPRLYRWLRGAPPAAVLAVKQGKQRHTGPRAFFATLRAYWKEVMCRDPLEQQPLDTWLDTHPLEWQEATDMEVNLLRQALRTMAMGKAAGMDNWPPEGLRPLPDALVPTLADLFKWCEAHAVWPTPWTRVRTQLCPKNNAPEKEPGAYRPIAILSTWFRLWSRWRLLMTTPDILDRFPPELCGGLPNRSPQGRMLTFMLTIKQLIHDVAHGHKDKQLLFVSLDASN